MNHYNPDPYSPTFLWFKMELENDLAKERERNDADLDAVKTAELRGRIQQIKHLLNRLNKLSTN
jgi:hypothetical protein